MTPTNEKVDQSGADERISPVLAALSDSKHWHQGDKWRNSSDPQEKTAWKAHMDVIDAAIEALQAQTAQAVAEVARHDILEKLTYHKYERDDMTLDDCLEYLANRWKKIPGRTERALIMQITELLAAAPQQAVAAKDHAQD